VEEAWGGTIEKKIKFLLSGTGRGGELWGERGGRWFASVMPRTFPDLEPRNPGESSKRTF